MQVKPHHRLGGDAARPACVGQLILPPQVIAAGGQENPAGMGQRVGWLIPVMAGNGERAALGRAGFGFAALRLPGSAAPWAFRSDGARVSVEDSIIVGPEGGEKTRAITLTVETATIRQHGEQSIRWGLRRVAKK